MNKKTEKTTFSKVISIIGIIALIYAIAMVGFNLVTTALGISATKVPTDSMVPAIKVNSIVFTNKKVSFDELKVGDIIVYKYDPVMANDYYGSEEINIIHRIIEINNKGVIVKGDNNAYEDPYTVTADMYVSKATNVILQGAGTIFEILTGRILRIIAILLIVIWILFGNKKVASQ